MHDLAAPSVGPAVTEAGPALSPSASPWLHLPGLRPVAVLRVHGGGLVITDSGSQYYFKLTGGKSVRLGVKVAF